MLAGQHRLRAMHAALDAIFQRLEARSAELRELEAHPPTSYEHGAEVDVSDAEVIEWKHRMSILKELIDEDRRNLDEFARAATMHAIMDYSGSQ